MGKETLWSPMEIRRLGITSIIDPRYAKVVVIVLNTLHKSLIILSFSDIDIYLQCYQSQYLV